MKDDGGPAFPAKRTEHRPIVEGGAPFPVEAHYTGLSIRDWFAGKALEWGVSSVLARPYLIPQSDEGYKALAEFSYRIADAMLAERKKRDE